MLSSPRWRHLGGARVADVRVVRPHDDARGAAVAVQVRDQLVERVGHVTVAQVPGAGVVGEHRAVVLLGVGDHGGVLLGEEVLVLGGEPVAQQVLAGAAAQLDELLDHPPPARLADAEQHRLPVARRSRRRRAAGTRSARGRAPRPAGSCSSR